MPSGGEPVLERARRALREELGRAPAWAAHAPGRVNLIGEHTDYNEGLVLPCAIDRGTVVVAARREDGRMRVHSTSLESTGELVLGDPQPGQGWLDYVQGVVMAFQAEGLPVVGLDVAIASDLPRESGLSSSASLQVAIATLLGAAAGAPLSGHDRARLAHRAESEFVGVPCGRMDQLASALGRADHALRIDCRDDSTRHVPLPGDRMRLLIADSGVRRQLAGGDYGRRRQECETGLSKARAAGLAPPGGRAWRDVPIDRLPELEAALEPVLFRRARHVLSESERVDGVCAAVATGDLARVGALLREGQRSLRDDFEVSRPELDALCEIADAADGCYGSRLTGAGFGGCTLHLVDPARADAVSSAIRREFAARYDRAPPILTVRPADGAGPLAPN